MVSIGDKFSDSHKFQENPNEIVSFFFNLPGKIVKWIHIHNNRKRIELNDNFLISLF